MSHVILDVRDARLAVVTNSWVSWTLNPEGPKDGSNLVPFSIFWQRISYNTLVARYSKYAAVADLIYRILKQYKVHGELVVAQTQTPQPPRFIRMLLPHVRNASPVIYVNPENWDRSLELLKTNHHTPLKRGDVISARWAPLVGELDFYEIVAHIPEDQVGPSLLPNWQKHDNHTFHRSITPLFIASTLVAVFFGLLTLTGQQNPTLWGTVFTLGIPTVFGVLWFRSR